MGRVEANKGATRMSVVSDRKMPEPKQLGQHMASTVGQPIFHWSKDEAHKNPCGYRVVMGYFLPTWQRGLVWTQDQQVKLIESLWYGLNIGTYTFNRPRKGHNGPYDNLLIDGQQRMYALQCYLENRFPVLGSYWRDVTDVDRRGFEFGRHFHCYITDSTDEQYLRDYYNMMNFGGVAHRESERA